jgi:hypothetical protein
MDYGDIFKGVEIDDIASLISLGVVEEAQNIRDDEDDTNGTSSGADYIRQLLSSSNEKRIYSVLRIKRETFKVLCQWMRKNQHLRDSRKIPVEQQVAMFLWIINYSASYRQVAERFGIKSLEPISWYCL